MQFPDNNYLASDYGISPANSDNSTAWNLLVSIVRASAAGGRIWLDAGHYLFQTATIDPGGSPLEILGSGTDITYLDCAGALLTSGDLITPKRNFRCFGLTFGATSVRSGGTFIKVIGDMLITDIPLGLLMNIEFGDVNMVKGYIGVELVDLDGSHSVVGFWWDGGWSTAHSFAVGGTVHGGCCNKISNVMHTETYNAADGVRPYATVRIRGCADLRLDDIESVGARYGLVIDPPAGGRAATIFTQECIWGATTQEAVLIAPASTADCHSIEITGGYIDSGGISVNQYAFALFLANIEFLGNFLPAIKLDGTSGVVMSNMMFAGANSKCLYALNGAKNFRLTGGCRNFGGNANTLGVHIAAGCDKYKVDLVGSEYCTTPTNVPANDATKTVSFF